MKYFFVFFLFWNVINGSPIEKNNFMLTQHIGSDAADTRIIGGDHCRAGQFPFAVAINISTIDSSVFCGGSLIHPQWILTAAHCVENAITITITLGSITLSEDEPSRQIMSTTMYYLHPNFDKTTLDNDIALVQLRESIEFNDYIGKIHLPVTSYGADVNVTAIGWGQTNDSNSNIDDNLNCVSMVTISNPECKIFFGSQITDNMICVSGNYHEGICTGDSGSPLVYLLNYRHPILVGIASFHSAFGCEGVEPSGFTRTFPHRDWILNITGPLS